MIDELPFWQNGKGFTNQIRQRLILYDQNNQTLTSLSPATMQVSKLIYKNNHIYYFGVDYQSVMVRNSSLYELNLTDYSSTLLSFVATFLLKDLISFSDRLVCYGNFTARLNSYQNGQFYTYENSQLKPLNQMDINLGATMANDTQLGLNQTQSYFEDKFYYCTIENTTSVVRCLDKVGIDKVIFKLPHGAIYSLVVFKQALYLLAAPKEQLPELYCYNLSQKTLKQLTNFQAEFYEIYLLNPVIPLTFSKNEQLSLAGFVVLPADFQPAKSYPAILTIRGGPKGVSGANFMHEYQLLAAAGYFVIYCNPRGSDGRGSEFANIEKERFGQIDYQDLLDFLDFVLAKYPAIDQTRLGVMGGSYGGLMTNTIITRTNRFKAAISVRSIASYITKTLTTDIGYYHNTAQISELSLWDDLNSYWERSPLSLATQVKTPVLLIHSDEDYRCYLGDVLQFYKAFKLHNAPVKLCLFHGENHELSRSGKPLNRFARIKEILDFWKQHLKENLNLLD